MLKQELVDTLEELFALGGNQDLIRLTEVRSKLVYFLSQTEQLLGCQDNENVVIAKDVVRFCDANVVYADTTNRAKANKHIQPFFDRLLQLDSWSSYELKILTSSVEYIENVDQLREFSHRVILEFSMFENPEHTKYPDELKGYFALNMCSRLLYAKFFDDADDEFLVPFMTWAFELEELSERNNELAEISLVTQVRRAVFHQSPLDMSKLLIQLKNDYDAKVYAAIEKEVGFYLASEKYINYFKNQMTR